MVIQHLDESVGRACAAIEEILAALERDTGQLIEDLSLERIDVTTMVDENRQHKMTVRIDMYRIPGHQW